MRPADPIGVGYVAKEARQHIGQSLFSSVFVRFYQGRGSSFVAKAAYAGRDVGELLRGYRIAAVALKPSPGRPAARTGSAVVYEFQGSCTSLAKKPAGSVAKSASGRPERFAECLRDQSHGNLLQGVDDADDTDRSALFFLFLPYATEAFCRFSHSALSCFAFKEGVFLGAGMMQRALSLDLTLLGNCLSACSNLLNLPRASFGSVVAGAYRPSVHGRCGRKDPRKHRASPV